VNRLGAVLPRRATGDEDDAAAVQVPAEDLSKRISNIFVARTNIRLRSSADVASEPTGQGLKEGEVFKATEVAKGLDGMTYLRVGERGWAFRTGIAGRWVGQPIVEAVPEGMERDKYESILSDPKLYAEYREVMDDPNYVDRIRQLMEQKGASARKEASADAITDLKQFKQEAVREFGQWIADPRNLPELEQQWNLVQEEASAGGEGDEQFGNVSEMLSQDPEIKELIEELQEAQTKAKGPGIGDTVVPKWMRLENTDMADDVDEDGQPKRPKVVRELPGGPEALRWRPLASGCRMGIRVPSVCSPL